MPESKAPPGAIPSTVAPGPGIALLSYLFLFLGFIAIGFSTQSRDAVAGLWVTEAVAITLPALIALRAANVKPIRYLGAGAPTAAMLLVAALLAFLNQGPVTLLEHLAQQAAPAGWVKSFIDKNHMLEAIFSSHKLGMVLTVTIAAPLGEELFFRGFALPALAQQLGPIPAVVISGLLFAVLHMDPVGFIGLWELGILFGVLRWATGSVWPAVAAHSVNNGLAATAFLLGLQKPEDLPPKWLLWAGAALLAAAAPFAYRALRAPSPQPARIEPWTGDWRVGFRLRRAWPMIAVWLIAFTSGLISLLPLIRPLTRSD